MDLFRLVISAAMLFFCLWSALLARLKGYSALCWVLAGGPVGVVLLWRLPLAGPCELKRQRKCNRLGLLISTACLLAVCIAKVLL
jgi:hypothetical protein